jgi:hypothetical protein
LGDPATSLYVPDRKLGIGRSFYFDGRLMFYSIDWFPACSGVKMVIRDPNVKLAKYDMPARHFINEGIQPIDQ